MKKHNLRIIDSDTNCSSSYSDTILRAALREGVSFPYECNSGGCGSCKFELVSGEIEEFWPDAPGLSRRDIKKGKKLACQCRMLSDCNIKVALEKPSNTQISKPERTSVTFLHKTKLTPDMAEFTFRSQGKADFLSGQFASFQLPRIEGDRAYSMSNVKNNEGLWSFIIKYMPGGRGSAYMFNELKPGEKLLMDGPFGHAYLREDNSRDIVCVAGGSGLSPIVSIVKKASENPKFEGRNLHFFFGGRTPIDICIPDLLKTINHKKIILKNYNAISDLDHPSSNNWTGETGFIHECMANVLGDDIVKFEYYFCGPPPMTKAIQSMLMIEHQVPFNQLHFDRFF